MKQQRLSEIVIFILVLGMSRLVMTFIPNFNPIGAMALFGGAVLASKRLAYIIPLAALAVSYLVQAAIAPQHVDYILMAKGDYSILFVFVAFAITVFLGQRFLSGKRTFGTIAGTAVASSVIFFILTNFASWMAYYPATPEGLLAAYTAGLAFYNDNALQNFFLNGLVSTVFFSAVAFYAYEWSAKLQGKAVVAE